MLVRYFECFSFSALIFRRNLAFTPISPNAQASNFGDHQVSGAHLRLSFTGLPLVKVGIVVLWEHQECFNLFLSVATTTRWGVDHSRRLTNPPTQRQLQVKKWCFAELEKCCFHDSLVHLLFGPGYSVAQPFRSCYNATHEHSDPVTFAWTKYSLNPKQPHWLYQFDPL